jgi:hypothetical protein
MAPRISPPGKALEWMLAYIFPAFKSVTCSGVMLNVPEKELAVVPTVKANGWITG